MCFAFVKGQQNQSYWIKAGAENNKAGNYQEAISCYSKAIDLNTYDTCTSTAYNGRGGARYNSGDYFDAVKDYKSALKLNRKEKSYRLNLKMAYRAHRKILGRDNYYSPFHQKIKDTTNCTVSEWGFYVMGGLGFGADRTVYSSDAAGSMVGCSIAYKSHVISFSRVGVTSFSFGEVDGNYYYQSNYAGLLFGESYRWRRFFLSLSAGGAYTYLYETSSYANNHAQVSINKQVFSVPVEFKYFWLAHNGIGFGFQISYNVFSSSQLSTLYFHAAVVFGGWNRLMRNPDVHSQYIPY